MAVVQLMPYGVPPAKRLSAFHLLNWTAPILAACFRLEFMDPSVDTTPIAPALAAFFDDVLNDSVTQLNFRWGLWWGPHSGALCAPLGWHGKCAGWGFTAFFAWGAMGAVQVAMQCACGAMPGMHAMQPSSNP